MKPLLITNFTKRDYRGIKEFLTKYNLYGCTLLVQPDDFVEELNELLIHHGVNVVIPFYSVSDHLDSLDSAETRNPGIEERILAFPAHKLSLLRRSKEDPDHRPITHLSISFPHNRIFMAKCEGIIDGFYQEREAIMGMQSLGSEVLREQLGVDGGEDSLADIQEPLLNIDYRSNFDNFYAVFDYSAMKNIGLIGAEECIQIKNL